MDEKNNDMIAQNPENSPEQNRIIAKKAEEIRRMSREEVDNLAITYFFKCLKLKSQLRISKRNIRYLTSYKNNNEKVKGIQKAEKEKYFNAGSWVLKVIQLIRSNEKVMTRQQMVNRILEFEPDLKIKWKNSDNRISKILSIAVNSHLLCRYRNIGTTGFYYGLPEWFDVNNNPKPTFK